jgi:hypothetical protein
MQIMGMKRYLFGFDHAETIVFRTIYTWIKYLPITKFLLSFNEMCKLKRHSKSTGTTPLSTEL